MLRRLNKSAYKHVIRGGLFMYHINHEGKVYPCRARILKCPYGADMHAETKEELYYKIMSIEREVEVPSSVISEVSKIGRLKSLQPISKELETSPHPIETIITRLDYAINMQLRPNAIENQKTFGLSLSKSFGRCL